MASKKEPEISPYRKLFIVVAAALLAQLLYGRQIGSSGVIAVLATLCLVGIGLWYTRRHWEEQKVFRTLQLGTFVLTLLAIFLRGNVISALLLVCFALVQLGVFALTSTRMAAMGASVFSYLLLPLSLARMYLGGMLRSMGEIFTSAPKAIASSPHVLAVLRRARPYLVGLVLGLPLIYLLASLLSHADPIFAKALQKILPRFSMGEMFFRVVWSSIVLALLWPLRVAVAHVYHGDRVRSVLGSISKELLVVVGMVTILLLGYIIIEWPYIFVRVAAETDLSAYGVATYSEYVRKGFGELLFVAMIVYGVVGAGVVALRRTRDKTAQRLQLVQTILLVLVGIFIASIFRRVWLYQTFHGWTMVRIYGGLFLLWLAGMFGGLALRVWTRLSVVRYEVIYTVLALFILGFWNIEEFIVQTKPPTVNGRVDLTYLSDMSADGYRGWVQAYKGAEEQLVYAQTLMQIDQSNRCNTLYSQVVINDLVRHHHELVGKYGTEKELQEYVGGALGFFEAYINRINNSYVDYPLQEQYKNLKGEALRLKEAYARKEKTVRQVYDMLYPRNMYLWSSMQITLQSSTHADVYGIDTRNRSSDRWAYLGAANGAEMAAWKNMQRDIPLAKLYDMTLQYETLHARIAAQGEGQNACTPDMGNRGNGMLD